RRPNDTDTRRVGIPCGRRRLELPRHVRGASQRSSRGALGPGTETRSQPASPSCDLLVLLCGIHPRSADVFGTEQDDHTVMKCQWPAGARGAHTRRTKTHRCQSPAANVSAADVVSSSARLWISVVRARARSRSAASRSSTVASPDVPYLANRPELERGQRRRRTPTTVSTMSAGPRYTAPVSAPAALHIR